jgi:hypothetical protein
MSTRYLILRVEVLETEEYEGTGTKSLCLHSEYYKRDDVIKRQDELLQCAYEGFNQARNKFCGIDNPPATEV